MAESIRNVFGGSLGAFLAPVSLVLEPRFKAAVLLAGGYWWAGPLRPELDPYNFTPHVHQPVLMINGRYDFTSPLERSQLPMFHDLGTADKQHILFERSHSISDKQTVEVADQWLRETLGSR